MSGRSPGSRVVALCRAFPTTFVASGMSGQHSPHTVAGAASAPDALHGSAISEFPVRFPALCAEWKTKQVLLWRIFFDRESTNPTRN